MRARLTQAARWRRVWFLVAAMVTAVAFLGRGSAPASASGVTSVSAGSFHTCAIATPGGARCWGSNGSGQLGDGTNTDSSTPVDVSGMTSGVAAVSAGTDHTCAVTTGGGVKCWGSNVYGQLGNGTTTDSGTAVDVTGLTSGVVAVSVSTGGFHTCALTTASGVKCWGRNENGQLGNSTNTGPESCSGAPCSTTPVNVTGLTSGVVAVSAGTGHTCALATSGGVKCWGWNYYGQLGDGAACGTICSTGVDVTGLTSSGAAVSAGGFHTCAVTTSGGVKCWGDNGYGELGDGAACGTICSTAVDVTGLTGSGAAVSAGYANACALTTAGGVKCWGYNVQGQLGDGHACSTYACTTPVDVSGLTAGVAVVSAGDGHACALTTTGGIKCWGDNYSGELGNGTTTTGYPCTCIPTPVDVVRLKSTTLTPTSTSFHTPTRTPTNTPISTATATPTRTSTPLGTVVLQGTATPTRTPGPPLGGVAAYPDASSGSNAGLLAGVFAATTVCALAVGAAGWYARRPLVNR